jgi:hypothetical protein
VADVGLDRPEPAVPAALGGFAKRLGQRRHFDRVAEVGAGAVAFDVVDGIRRDVRDGERLCHGRCLPVHARRQVPRLGCAVVVHGRALDDRVDVIAGLERVLQTPQHDDARTAAKHRPLGAVIERPAMSVRRKDLPLLVQVAAAMGQLDRRAAGERHVALARKQTLGSQMHCDQRRRARRLHVDAWAAQVQEVGDPRREKVLVVPGVPQQEHPHRVDEVRVRADVEVEVAAHSAAGEDADTPGKAMGGMSSVFERFPRHLGELTVLGIEDGGLPRSEPEEVSVEMVHPSERRTRLDVVRVLDEIGTFTRTEQVLVRVGLDALDSVPEVLPVLGGVRGPGNPQGQPDDRNIAVKSVTHGSRRCSASGSPIAAQFGTARERLTPICCAGAMLVACRCVHARAQMIAEPANGGETEDVGDG